MPARVYSDRIGVRSTGGESCAVGPGVVLTRLTGEGYPLMDSLGRWFRRR